MPLRPFTCVGERLGPGEALCGATSRPPRGWGALPWAQHMEGSSLVNRQPVPPDGSAPAPAGATVTSPIIMEILFLARKGDVIRRGDRYENEMRALERFPSTTASWRDREDDSFH